MSPSSKTLAPKTILVVGGTGEIGTKICQEAAELGFNVALTYGKQSSKAQDIQKSLQNKYPSQKFQIAPLDLLSVSDKSVESIFESIGKIDSIIFASGVYHSDVITNIDDQEWNRVLGINVTGPFQVVRSSLPYFVTQKSGQFIFLSSIASNGGKGLTAYATSKAALSGLSKSIAAEWGSRGISSLVLELGVIETDAVLKHMSEAMKNWRDRSPLKRFVKSEEVAQAVVSHCANWAQALNGAVISVSGGNDQL